MISLLFSCAPQELPVPKQNQGELLTSEVFLGENYDYQIYYSLRENKIIQKNLKTSWDIGFETSPDGYQVILNSSKLMFAYHTGKNDFQSVSDTLGFENGKLSDVSSGNLDSTAIGDWRNEQPVYILDRGATIAGRLGFVKLQILHVDDQKYEVRFKILPHGEESTIVVPKDNQYNFSYLSFEKGGQIQIVQPPKTEWDLCFTQYTVQMAIPYLVTGVLTNSYNTEAQKDSITEFALIDREFIEYTPLSHANDVIGYGWKHYELNADNYLVNPLINYLIKTQDGNYFKLHFIDYYNNEGVKGNPKWEFDRL